jgi:hypothetical protein
MTQGRADIQQIWTIAPVNPKNRYTKLTQGGQELLQGVNGVTGWTNVNPNAS